MTNPEFRFDETPISPLMFIEASAGTGKTYTLQRLVLRFIVEKSIPIESFLIVTYTEALRPCAGDSGAGGARAFALERV